MTNPLKFRRHQDCPDARKHTKCPEGYVEWDKWAEKMGKTHDQLRCSTCGFFVIWKRKVKP